jgi:hypothetical protein
LPATVTWSIVVLTPATRPHRLAMPRAPSMVNLACTNQFPLVSRTDCTFGHSNTLVSLQFGTSASSSSVKRISLVPDGPSGPAGPCGPAGP